VRIEHDLPLQAILMGESLANYVKSLDCRCELASEARTKTGNELLLLELSLSWGLDLIVFLMHINRRLPITRAPNHSFNDDNKLDYIKRNYLGISQITRLFLKPIPFFFHLRNIYSKQTKTKNQKEKEYSIKVSR
jgi:hypothetical protein